ncbi:MAG: hypothetical protein U0N15_03650 [Bifidobacterium choerinum]
MTSPDIVRLVTAANAADTYTPPVTRRSPMWTPIRDRIEQRIATQPRSLQTNIGPSELGTTCVHCLAAKLAAWSKPPQAAWIPYIGTCVHKQFEQLFGNWQGCMTERRVVVGRLRGRMYAYDVAGSIDLWVPASRMTVDWKIVGNATLQLVRRHGVSQQYAVQASLYGIGLENEGLKVERSAIYYLPRNSVTLTDALPVEFDFDPQPGRWALNRAQRLTTMLDDIETELGAEARDAWISLLPRDREHCFDCDRWADSNPFDLPQGTLYELPERWTRLANSIESHYQPTNKPTATKENQ